jgi:hypothetical protein
MRNGFNGPARWLATYLGFCACSGTGSEIQRHQTDDLAVDGGVQPPTPTSVPADAKVDGGAACDAARPCNEGFCSVGICVSIQCASGNPCERGVCGLDGICVDYVPGGYDESCTTPSGCDWVEVAGLEPELLMRDACGQGRQVRQMERCNGTCYVPDDNYAGFAVFSCEEYYAIVDEMAKEAPGENTVHFPIGVAWAKALCCTN